MTAQKPTQRERVLALLSKGRWVHARELHEISWRYGARLYELRHYEGYEIERRRAPDGSGMYEWRLA